MYVKFILYYFDIQVKKVKNITTYLFHYFTLNDSIPEDVSGEEQIVSSKYAIITA